MTEKRFVYMDLLETEAISVSDDECYYFNEYGTVQKICELLNELHEENKQLKEDAKQVLFVLACCNKDFGLSVNEAKAIKRLNECVDGCYNTEGLE